MLLDHLGDGENALRLEAGLDQVMARGLLTPDLGGSATTAAFGAAVVAELEN
jgi:isocitrate/isopropylmalate dehydrogenase